MLDEDLEKILNEESLKHINGIMTSNDPKSMPAAAVVKLIAEKLEWKRTFALLLDIEAGNLIETFISKRFCKPAKMVNDRDLSDLAIGGIILCLNSILFLHRSSNFSRVMTWNHRVTSPFSRTRLSRSKAQMAESSRIPYLYHVWPHRLRYPICLISSGADLRSTAFDGTKPLHAATLN